MTDANTRKAQERARKRASGLAKLELWIPPAIHAAVRAYAAKLTTKETRMANNTNLAARIADADMYGSRWLADGNEYAERGDHARAEKCYAKCQYWLDRSNKLRGNG